MRYDAGQKQQTRQRIVAAAGRRFKKDGIDGSGVATLMKDAGLTNGAFYSHFESKDDLVAAAVADELRRQLERLIDLSSTDGDLESFVHSYLSIRHRDDVGQGCPSAALLDEIGRCSPVVKAAYTEGLLRIVDTIATQLVPANPGSIRVQVLAAFGSMVGTLQLARSLSDPVLADQILERGVHDTMSVLRVAARPQPQTPTSSTTD